MRICFVSMWYPPFTAGGSGVYAGCLCQELAELGHEIHVITPRFGFEEMEAHKKGVTIHRVPVIRKPSLWIPCYWLNVRSYYKNLHKKLRFDILHGNVNSDLTLFRNLVDIPRVVTIHHLGRTTFEKMNPSFLELLRNLGGEIGLASWIEKKTLDFDKIVAERADQIITVSDFCRREIIAKLGISPSRISVVYNGIYPEEYKYSNCEIRVRRGLGDINDFVILFVGRLEKRKGLPLLLRAFRLVSQCEKAKLVIVGSGKQDPFRKLAYSLGIDTKVAFLGSVDELMLRKIYSACDLFVSASYLEGFGMAILEAMASEKPVVALDSGGVSEVVKENAQGRLVSNPDYHMLADAILYFARNRRLAQNIGKRNREYAIANFSWRRTAKLTEQIYRKLL